MKKNKLIAMLLSFALCVCGLSAIACNGENVTVPETVAGVDTSVTSLKNAPDSYDAETVIYAVVGKLDSYSTFTTRSSGTSVAQKGFITYTQNTQCTKVKNGNEYYTDSISNSTLVNTRHEVMVKNGKAAYRNNSGTIDTATYDDYLAIYGVTPDKTISGHVFNHDSVRYAVLENVEGDTYTYKIVLDKDAAHALLVRQMKMVGGLDGYPEFTKDTEATLVIKKDFTPVSYSYRSTYNISIAVLGKVGCEEENTVYFENFNSEVTLPDSDAFNGAINEQPTRIDPGKTEAKDDNLEALVSALLQSDLENGIALNGSVSLGDVSLPLRIEGKADINGLMNGTANLYTAFQATASVISPVGNASVTYYDGKFYLDLFGGKFVFSTNVPEKNGIGITDIDTTKFFKITKSETDENTLVITLADAYNDVIAAALQSAGLIESKDEFSLSMNAYVRGGRVGVIGADFTFGETTASAEFALSDKKYTLPSDLDKYVSELTFSKKVDVMLGGAFDGDEAAATVTLGMTYDMSQPDPVKAFKAEAEVAVSKTVKSLLGIASMFTSDLPVWFDAFADAGKLNLVVENGNAYFLIEKESENEEGAEKIVTYFEKLGGLNAASAQDEEGAPSFDMDTIKEMLPVIAELLPQILTGNYEQGVVTVAVSPEIVSLINMLFWDNLQDTLIDSMGATAGAMVPMMLGIDKPLAAIELAVPVTEYAETLPSLSIYCYDIDTKEIFDENKEYDLVRVLSLVLSDNADYSYDKNVTEIAALYDKTENVRSLMTALTENYALTSEYYATVQPAADAFNALSDKEKQLVFNAYHVERSMWGGSTLTFLPEKVKADYENDKKAVDDFAASIAETEIASLNSKYGKFSTAQLNYLAAAHADKLAAYVDKRVESEQDAKTEIVSLISALGEFDLENAALDALYERLSALEEIYAAINECIPETLADADLTAFNDMLDKTVAAYATKLQSTAEQYLGELKGMAYGCTLTGEQLIEKYGVYETFSEKYCTEVMETSVGALIREKEPSVEAACYKVTLYNAYNRKGMAVAAAEVAEKEIDALLKGTYDEETVAAKIEVIETLIDYTDSKNVSNYEQFVEFKKNK